MDHLEPGRKRWIDWLNDEDLAFVKRFILCSGSLKDLAQLYDVTYPTLRIRLDRLIEKIKVFENQEINDEYEKLLRGLYVDGKIDAQTFKQLLSAYQQEIRASAPDRRKRPA